VYFIQDNPDLFDYNVDKLVEKFVEAIYDQKEHYLTNHIMLTMGSDFQYENAREVFKNLDKLMRYTMEKVFGGRRGGGEGELGEMAVTIACCASGSQHCTVLLHSITLCGCLAPSKFEVDSQD
jgi:hypothetical protein